jgi:ribosomal subunit interface protein
MIDIQISGVRFQISDRIRAYVQEKMGGLARYHQGLNKIHMTIHQGDKHGCRVDVDMHLPHGKDVVAHDSEETVYAAIDVVTEKCATQLRKIHSRDAEHPRDRIAV